MPKDKDKSNHKSKFDDIDTVLSNLTGKANKSGQKLFIYSDIPREKGEVIPFGISDSDIDAASGIGGIMRGRLVELFGPESGGKSFLTLKLMASAQELYPDRRVGLIDIEHSFDPSWAISHGVDVDNIIYGSDFDHAEDALNNMRSLIDSKSCSLVVLDSTAALIPKAELAAGFDDAKVAELGRIMSRAVRQIMDSAEKSNTAVVFINQIRSKIGVMFGDPETTPGGRALKFYAHMRLRVHRKGVQMGKDTKSPIGVVSIAKFVKNKLSVPFGKAEFFIPFTPEANHPVVKMLKLAHDVKLIRRKKDKDSEKVFFSWGKGKDAILIDGPDFIMAGDWLVNNNKVKEFLADLKVQAEEEGVVLTKEVLSLDTDNKLTLPSASSASKNDAPGEIDTDRVSDDDNEKEDEEA